MALDREIAKNGYDPKLKEVSFRLAYDKIGVNEL